MKYRLEKDTLGEVRVPADRYWGAQTQRSIENFKIGASHSMPQSVIEAFGYVKKAAAIINCELGVLSHDKMKLIADVCDEIIGGGLYEHFPLVIWQTGSGTQTNIANRAHVLSGMHLGEGDRLLHPNDDVNRSQSSNDAFSSAMNIAAYMMLERKSIPGIEHFGISLPRVLLHSRMF